MMLQLMYCYAECHYAECRYADCCCAERCGVINTKVSEATVSSHICPSLRFVSKAGPFSN